MDPSIFSYANTGFVNGSSNISFLCDQEHHKKLGSFLTPEFMRKHFGVPASDNFRESYRGYQGDDYYFDITDAAGNVFEKVIGVGFRYYTHRLRGDQGFLMDNSLLVSEFVDYLISLAESDIAEAHRVDFGQRVANWLGTPGLGIDY